MNKEKYNQIIDEVYDRYLTKYLGYEDVPKKEVFIHEIKTNKEFSERWELKIEERELSLEERKQIFEDRGYVCDVWPFNCNWDGEYDGFGIPRRGITIKYNNEIIESYE